MNSTSQNPNKIQPKHDLLVFNKKEVGIILMLLALVSLFSFTLGLRIGKKLTISSKEVQGQTEKHTLTKEVDEVHTSEPISTHAEEKHEHTSAASESHQNHVTETARHEETEVKAKTEDTSLEEELKNAHVKADKVMPMSYPESKKSEKHSKTEKVAAGKYTLQVGSHRTLVEATDQVKELKKEKLDAFYMEVNIPGKGTWYRVGVGMFSTKEMAEKYGDKIRKSGNLNSFIIQKVME